jgi:hypothetical protein
MGTENIFRALCFSPAVTVVDRQFIDRLIIITDF